MPGCSLILAPLPCNAFTMMCTYHIEVAVQADSELREMFRPFWSSQAAKAVHPRFACASEESAATAPLAACHHDEIHDGSDGWATEDGDSDGSLDGCDDDS